jgi:hypothetical protein
MEKELGDTYSEYGLMWKKKGDLENAKTYLNNALAIYEKLNLGKHMEKTRDELGKD